MLRLQQPNLVRRISNQPQSIPLTLHETQIERRKKTTHHTQQPPRRLARLRPDTQPVFRPRRVELDVLDRFAFARRRGLGNGVVGAWFERRVS